MATLKHLDKQSFDITINNTDTPVLVDFFADWCGPCKALAPTLEAIAGEQAGRLSVVKVDIDDNPELATKYGIQKIPTLILFEGGEAKAQITGVLSKSDLEERIRPFTGSGQPALN